MTNEKNKEVNYEELQKEFLEKSKQESTLITHIEPYITSKEESN